MATDGEQQGRQQRCRVLSVCTCRPTAKVWHRAVPDKKKRKGNEELHGRKEEETPINLLNYLAQDCGHSRLPCSVQGGGGGGTLNVKRTNPTQRNGSVSEAPRPPLKNKSRSKRSPLANKGGVRRVKGNPADRPFRKERSRCMLGVVRKSTVARCVSAI